MGAFFCGQGNHPPPRRWFGHHTGIHVTALTTLTRSLPKAVIFAALADPARLLPQPRHGGQAAVKVVLIKRLSNVCWRAILRAFFFFAKTEAATAR
jgi:hypothetical protein